MSLEQLQKIDIKGKAHNDAAAIFFHGGPGMDLSYFFPWADTIDWPCNVRFYTQGSTGAASLDQVIEEARQVIADLQADRVFLIGHSYGGCLVLELLKRLAIPNVCGAALMCYPLHPGWVKDFESKHGELVTKVESLIQGLEGNDRYKTETLSYASVYFRPGMLINGIELLKKIQYNSELYRVLGAEHLNAIDYRQFLSSVSIPIFSLAGCDDEIISESHILAAVHNGGSSNLTHVTLHPGSHFPWIDRPSIVGSLLVQFLTQLIGLEK